MGLSDRIEQTVERWQAKWKDRLHGWMASWLSWGLELILDVLGKGLAKRLDTIIDEKGRELNIPPETIEKTKDLWKGEGEWQALLGSAAGGTAVGGIISSTIGPWLKLVEYAGLGVAHSFRLDPFAIITAWRRDPAKYEWLWQDLRDQGWRDDRIEALKFLTLFIPTADEQTLWLAREVFEPDMVDRYGLDDELPKYEETDFAKVGVNPEQMVNKWRAHWEHASFMQVIEMLHRGLLTLAKEAPEPPTTKEGWDTRDAEGEEALFDWYRLVEIPPFWRDRLTAMSWNVPTRVDVRRWWDMRTISEDELRNIYHRQGYHGADLENYVRWTKVYTDFPMMMARFTKGWITEQDVRDWLKGLEIPEDRIQQFIEEKTKPEKGARTATERDLTATEIMKAVKKGIITESEGIELLTDLGYDEEEASFKLLVYGAVEAGSPETLPEFKELTSKWRRSVGKEAKLVTEELKAAAAEVVRLTKEVESLSEAVKAEERTLVEEETLPKEATAKRDELRLALHRAESELHRVKTDYNALLAEWRHGG